MSGLEVRRLMTVVDELLVDGGRRVRPTARVAAAFAVIENPWFGQGFVDDLSVLIDEVAPQLGALLAPRAVSALAAPCEAYGKVGICGTGGELEHASGLIHTLKFGNPLRDAVGGSSLLPAVEKIGLAGAGFDVPLKHITDATTRSHHQTVELVVPGSPRADEILIGMVVASRGRPHSRLAELATEL